MRNRSNQILDEQMISRIKCKYLILFAVAALTAFLYPPLVSADSVLGTAENFAVLAGTPNITNTGPTTITGDVGIHPGAEITGKGQITITGVYHEADAVALKAKEDLTKAYTSLNNMPAKQTLTNAQLGGSTLTSGVYAFGGNPDTVLLTGILTLNAEGKNNAYWVFQIPNALTTAVGSSVVVENFGSNGGNDYGLFWVVGSSAGIFGSTSFEGNILALTSITLNNSATIMNGRALARNGTVTMDTNTISNVCPIGGPGNGGPGYSGGLVYDSAGNIVPIGASPGPGPGPGSGPGPSPVPEPTTILLLGLGLTGIAGLRKKMIRN